MTAHHPPGTAPARHAQAPQTMHTHPPACAQLKPPCPDTTVRPQIPPAVSHRMPPLCAPTATTDGPTLQPRPLGLLRSRTAPHPLPPLSGPKLPSPRAARSPSRAPPTSHPSFLGPLTDAPRDHLGGYYVADAADHAWTIAIATCSAPLPPHSLPPRHSGRDLSVAAYHILRKSF